MKRKKLSLHVSQRVETAPACDRAPRGSVMPPIVEVADSPDGLMELKIRDSRGNRIGFFQMAADCLDDELEEALRDWQARHANAGANLSIS